MESFIVDDRTKYMCAGPIGVAFNACKLLEREAPEPTCWQASPRTFSGGTVMVHDVDMRIPVRSGRWIVGRLYTAMGCICGGMVWHESVGGPQDAANLIRQMEDAGAPVICNTEPNDVLNLGVRFIGRYSWQDSNSENDPLMETLHASHCLHLGPEFYFAPQETIRRTIIPTYTSSMAQVDDLVNAAIASRRAANEEEKYNGQFQVEALYDGAGGSPSAFSHLRFPSVAVYDNAGVGFTFANQEYLFGRVWFDKDKDQTQCYAMCFYTYASPDYFAFMRLEEAPVCPSLPLPWPISAESQNDTLSAETTTDTVSRNPIDFIATRLVSNPDNTDVAAILQNMTTPLRHGFYKFIQLRNVPLLERLCLSGGLTITASLFSLLMPQRIYDRVDDDVLLLILRSTSDAVIRLVGEQEITRFRAMNERFRSRPDRPFEVINEDYIEATRPCALACLLERPTLVVFAELLRRGYPAGPVLAESVSNWPRSVIAEAALQNNVEAVGLLLDAGASVDDVVEGDEWNAMAYAVYGKADAVVEELRRRFPDHDVWTRHDVPLDMKASPNMFCGLRRGGHDPATNIEVVKRGTLDDLATIRKECND